MSREMQQLIAYVNLVQVSANEQEEIAMQEKSEEKKAIELNNL